MSNTKIALYIIIVALIGGFIGANLYWHRGAFVLDDFFNSLTPSGFLSFQSTSTPQVQINSITTPYAPTIDYEQAVVGAVEKTEPGVVSIIISKNVPIIENCPYDPFADLPPDIRQFFGGDTGNLTQPCQKGTQLRKVGGGSGFVIDQNGLIVTNKHVVSDTEASYTVFTNDGKKYDAKVLAADPVLDFAVVKINATELHALTLGDSDSIKLGQTAIAIGNALGEYRNTVSVGVVSGLSRNITASGGTGTTENIEGVIQTDTAINPGNSGGPLLNLRGEVIGINTAIASGAENISFSIPINQVKRAIASINQSGKIASPYIGVRYITINEALAAKNKLSSEYGVLV